MFTNELPPVVATVPLTVYVTLAPTGKLIVSLRLPLPEVRFPDAAPGCHTGKSNRGKVPGNVSTTVAPVTAFVPTFDTTMYNVLACPALPGSRHRFGNCQIDQGRNGILSVAVLFAVLTSVTPLGAVTVAVFTTVPVRSKSPWRSRRTFTELLAAIVMVSAMLPVPLAVFPLPSPL